MKFLEQVADYFIGRVEDLSGLTLVFPNRRSALFMRKYMHERMQSTRFMPRMVSISYFTQTLCSTPTADEHELAFILYNVYCGVLRRHGRGDRVPDFDEFYFWGRVLLNDFNDIDAYMADPHQVLSNIKSVNELRSNYLTEEQLEVARLLWGPGAGHADLENFWAHVHDNKTTGEATDEFLRLWEIMGEIYDDFNRELDERDVPVTYSGMQSRRAAERVAQMDADDLRGQRYAFIGFNVLSTSRALIFKRLQQLGLAQFFWDAEPARHTGDGDDMINNGAKIVQALARRFKMPDDFELQPAGYSPQIEIVGVPSNVGQVKVASSILSKWSSEWDKQGMDEAQRDRQLIDTAVVLADEAVLMPMIYSVPDEYTTINVTMGLPFAATPFAALLSSIISMHMRSYVTRGTQHYYYQDVVAVLGHPHITLVAPDDAVALRDEILAQHIYNVDSAEVVERYPSLAFIFAPLTDAMSVAEVKAYVSNLVDTLSQRLRSHLSANASASKYYETAVLDAFAAHMEYLTALAERYRIAMHRRTFMQILEGSLRVTKLNFAGEPLKGLQIMDMMQTRALDFDNLIIVSTNEKVLPRRNYSPSLIPATLRAAYMLPTQQQEEESYAYQFFRLISRARRVKLLYDSSVGGLSSGEMSRYAAQLRYLYKHLDVRVHNVDPAAEAKEEAAIEIHKTPEVVAELRRFREGGDRRLSASALKTYLMCPLKFYLQYAKGLRVNNDNMDYIDAASFGTVLHRLAEEIYNPYKGVTINEGILDKMIGENLAQRAMEILNKVYYRGRYSADLNRMPTEGRIVARIISKYIKLMLKAEKKYVPFTFIGAEVGERETFTWRVNDRYTLNFTMSVDRIDAMGRPDSPGSCYRFIDYKTGSDELKSSNLDKIFTDHTLGGYFQLLVYCYAYASRKGYDGPIRPMIYKFQEISQGISGLRFKSKDLADYHDVEGFYEKFEELIDRIFEEDDAYPFTQTDNTDNCTYCEFAALCRRYIIKDK